MVDTFNWPVDDGPSGNNKFRRKVARFGEGYEQRVGDGLNNINRDWNVTVRSDWATLDAIGTFLEAHADGTPFYWTPPGATAVQRLWTCDGYTFSPRSGTNGTLSAAFTECFDLV